VPGVFFMRPGERFRKKRFFILASKSVQGIFKALNKNRRRTL
jgi:hypothetical protein